MANVDPAFLWDEPLGPGQSPQLSAITRALAKALPRTPDRGPITFAVYGPWGSGKTTFLRYFLSAVNRRDQADAGQNSSEEVGGDAVTIWFEPWRYEREPDLLIPLLTEIVASAQKSIKRSNAAKQKVVKTGMRLLGRVAKAAARTATGFVAERIGVERGEIERIGQDFMSFYEGESNRFQYPESENEQFKRDFEDLIRFAATGRLNGALDDDAKPVIIFVDDLDRCESEQVKRLLESMKNFLWVPGVVYVLALDRAQVTLALAEPYVDIFKGSLEADSSETPLAQARERAKSYLEKFFLYEFDIGDGAGRFEQAVVKPVFDQLVADLRAQFGDKLSPEYEQIFEQASLNLRRLKRIARWLYYEFSIDHARDDLLAFFAEQVFSENYGRVWLKQFESQSLQSRASYYTRVFEALAVCYEDAQLVLDSETKERFLRAIRDGRPSIRPEGGTGKDSAADAQARRIGPGFAGAENLAGSALGSWLDALVDSDDFAEINRVYKLVATARHVGRRSGRL